MSCKRNPARQAWLKQAGQFADNDANVFGALRHGQTGQLFHTQDIGPVVGHRADVIQPVGVGDGGKVAVLLRDFFVVAMEVTENRRQFDHGFAVQNHIHAKDAVGGGMMRPHRHFEEVMAGGIAGGRRLKVWRRRNHGFASPLLAGT